MEQQIEADAPLDYVEFRISPQNNYNVSIHCCEVEEKVGYALADQILAHLREGSFSKGSHADIKLQLPQNLDDTTWFTKATLTGLLKTTDSPDVLRKIIALSNEMSQLEETRKFHLSLYGQAENRTLSSDDSKNKLLRAMDLRLTALGEELATAFNLEAGEACSHEETEGSEKFCEHFGHTDLRNTLYKLLESIRSSKVNNSFNYKKTPVTSETQFNPVHNMTGDTQISQPSNSDQPVKYGASSMKVAQAECQSLTESDMESSNSSIEEKQPSAERSRTLVRSATPRRSASPMRRIQIGRSGSRRTPAIAIKSLSYFPGRERAFSLRDNAQDDDGEEVGSEWGSKVPESNVRRMSVQDAINLFERKQRDQSTDVQQRKPEVDNPVKSVLRRWSSGMSESSAQLVDHCISENKEETSSHRLVDEKASNVAQEIQPEADPVPNLSESARAIETGGKMERGDVGSLSPQHTDITVAQDEGTSEKMDSAEWNRKKEDELNHMLMSFALIKPIRKYQKTGSEDSKNNDSQTGKRGGFYDQYKNRRNPRLHRENVEALRTIKQAIKKTDKKGPARTVQKSLDKAKKVEISSANGNDVGKKEAAGRTQNEKVVKRLPLSSNTKRELPRAIVQKAPPKSSSLPATRKSWPSTPSSRATRTTAAKTPPGTTSSSALSCQKSQLSAPLSRSISKIETLQPQRKEVRKTQVENKWSSQSMDENKLQMVPKSVKSTKAKVVSVSEEKTSTVPVKPGLRSKVTKKSSVVPLETKPSNNTRKASATSPVKSPTPKKSSPSVKEPQSKCKTPVKEPLTKCEAPICSQDDEVVILRASELTNQKVLEPETDEIHHVDLKLEPQVQSLPPYGEQKGIPCEVPAKCDENIEKIIVSSDEIQHEEESLISPTAWVEDVQEDLPIPSRESASELASSTNHGEVASSGARVRHSLSQMLLEESSDTDIIEWGNAENPPSMAFQREAPKGLKRLLKFARKSKGEANMAGCSSSPYTSEGEDNGDEGKGFGKKNSDNLLKKAALNASHYGHYGISSEGYDKSLSDPRPLSVRSNASNSSFQSSSSDTSKASRSFFSLSAFRGNKATDTKMR